MARRKNQIPLPNVVYILGEGYAEEEYFKFVSKQYKYNNKYNRIIPKDLKGRTGKKTSGSTNIISTVEKFLKSKTSIYKKNTDKRKHITVYLILDKDIFGDLETIQQINKSIKISSYKITVIWSEPSFDLRLLWHYCDRNKEVETGILKKEVGKHLSFHDIKPKKTNYVFTPKEITSAITRSNICIQEGCCSSIGKMIQDIFIIK